VVINLALGTASGGEDRGGARAANPADVRLV